MMFSNKGANSRNLPNAPEKFSAWLMKKRSG